MEHLKGVLLAVAKITTGHIFSPSYPKMDENIKFKSWLTCSSGLDMLIDLGAFRQKRDFVEKNVSFTR